MGNTTCTGLIATTLTVLVLTAGTEAGQDSPREGALQANRTASVALYLDTSGSMQGSRATALKQGAKLAVATLDSNQEVVIISFSHVARAARFPLRTPADRQAAMQHIDS